MKITRKSTGHLEKLKKQLSKKKSSVKVGILHGKYPNGTNTALVGFWAEYGTKHAPERSFIRSTLHDNKDYKSMTKKIATSIVKGRRTTKQGLGILGQTVKQDIQDKIVNLKSPPNTEATIKAKGSSNVLIDTGVLLGSIDYDIEA